MPAGVARSTVTARLLPLAPWNSGLHSHHASCFGDFVLEKRMRSGRVTDSTLITSAPRHARTYVIDGPAHHAVRSSTRTPASGNRSLGGSASRPRGPHPTAAWS